MPPSGDDVQSRNASALKWFKPSLLVHALIDVLLPPQCGSCGKIIAVESTLCPSCWRDMPFIDDPVCERYGTPLPVDYGGPLLSPRAIAEPPAFQKARAAARYAGPARDLIHKLKYNDRTEVYKLMATRMVHAGREILSNNPLLAPIPLHHTRLFSRRYNQATLLASEIARQTGHPLSRRLLIRTRRSIPQVGLSRAERAKNVTGIFKVHEAEQLAIKDRVIVLIDDVMTSGATAQSATQTLLKAGAKEVNVLTFALVTPEL
jgi:ComF family protein